MAYFPDIKKIEFEGQKSTNPFAFRYYNPKELVNGKTMEELLRFSVAYWHLMQMVQIHLVQAQWYVDGIALMD